MDIVHKWFAKRRERGMTLIERGMTLIEIMIVIAIIGMIAALVINRYTHALGVGQAGATQMELKQIATALDLYNIDNNGYPVTAPRSVAPGLFGGFGNQYMGNTPTDGGVPYAYTEPSGATDYTVCSLRSVPRSTIPNINTSAGGLPTDPTTLCYSPQYGIYAGS